MLMALLGQREVWMESMEGKLVCLMVWAVSTILRFLAVLDGPVPKRVDLIWVLCKTGCLQCGKEYIVFANSALGWNVY